jgi:WD40 repeat protein
LVAGIAAALVLVIGVGLVVLKPWGDGSASEKPITGARFAGALSAHTSYVNAVAVSPDGKVIATAGQDEKVYFWNAGDRKRSGSPLESFENSVEAIAFSPDGKRLASVAYGQVRLWDVKGRRADGSPLPGGTSDIDDVRFSADGETLWASGTDGTVLAWDVAQGRAKKSTKISFDASAQHTLLSPDGSKLLVESIGKLQFYNVKSGKPIGVPLKNESESSLSYYSMAFSPDGKTVAGGASNGSVVLWEVASRRPLGADLKPAPVNGSSSGSIVNALTFSADGKALASGGYDRSVQLWDIAGRKPLGGPLTGHTAGVTSLAFSPDDDLLVSASQDKTARVWNVTH